MTEKRTSGMRPWLKVLLALSLALNLVVVGIAAGAAWRFRDGPPKGQRPPLLGAFIFKDLGRKEVNQLLRAQSETGEHPRVRHRREMQQIIELLRQETLDVDAVRALVETHAAGSQELMQAVSLNWIQRLEGLSLSQRQEVAKRMQDYMERGPRRTKGGERERRHED